MAGNVDAAVATMMRNLEEKTGRSLDEWADVARASGHAKHGEIVSFLKSEHGLGHGYANLVAQRVLNPPEQAAGEGALVESQYAGKKAGLRPIYDAIVSAVEGFGDDVEISPKKGYVSLRRSKQFAIVQPSTADRVDVGINLKGVAPEGRLEPSGSFNAMVSHRVRVTSRDEVDGDLVGWLRQAYEGA
jgi:hypothetical protein